MLPCYTHLLYCKRFMLIFSLCVSRRFNSGVHFCWLFIIFNLTAFFFNFFLVLQLITDAVTRKNFMAHELLAMEFALLTLHFEQLRKVTQV